MITWMQKHKKWLIVTIWISTIAFVGAGFVGWGSYNYGKSNSTIAIVGDEEVSQNDLQLEYNALYSQYKQILGDNFNQELAKQFKLDQVALQQVIQKYLLINYANNLGLMVTDEEVAKEIVQIKAFYKDGKFDKSAYISVLKQNRTTTAKFEEQLKKDLLVAKVKKLFNISLQKNEIKNISELFFSEDEVSINIIDGKKIKIKPTNKELKAYWKEHKNNYQTPKGFEISYVKVDTINNKTKKEMKKIALKKYLRLKQNKENFTTTTVIYENSSFLNPQNLKKVLDSDKKVLKPLYQDGSYYIVKLNKAIKPQPLPYEKAKKLLTDDYISYAKAKILDTKAKQLMKNFQGKSLWYISKKNLPKTIKGLDDNQKEQFLKELFATTQQLNKLDLGDKVVVYKITNSKLATYDPKLDNIVKTTVENIKTNYIYNSLVKQLQDKYEVISYMGKQSE